MTTNAGCESVYSFAEVNRRLWRLPTTTPPAGRRDEPDWSAALQSVEKAPEEQTGVVARCFLKWLNPYITLASRERLEEIYMPPPQRAHHAVYCGAQLSRAFREEEVRTGRDAWRARVEPVWPARNGDGNGATPVSCNGGGDHGCHREGVRVALANELARVGFCGEGGVRGRLRWVGYVRSSDTPHELLGGVEWDSDSTLPSYRERLAGDAAGGAVHDGCVHGERLFYQAQPGPARCTCEYVRDLVPLLASGTEYSVRPRMPRAPSLLWTLLRTFRADLIAVLPPSIVSMICELSTPLLLQQFVIFLKSDREREGVGKGLFFFSLFVIFQLALPAVVNEEMQRTRRLASLFRTSTLAVVFEKCLTVSHDALSRPDMSAGRVLAMASSDLENITEFCLQFKFLWMAPIMLAVNVFYLFVLVGSSALAAVVVFLAALPMQGGLTNTMSGIQAHLTSFTDIRLRRTNELLSGIRVVKTMGWESKLVSGIEYDARSKELGFRRRRQLCQVGLWACVFSTPTLMIAAVLSTYTLRGHELDASVVLPLIAIISNVTYPIMMLPEAFTSIAKFIVSTGRITKFLECDDSHVMVEHAERVFKDSVRGTAASKDAELPSAASVVAERVLVSVPAPLPLYEPRHAGLRGIGERFLGAVLRRRTPVELQWRRVAVSAVKDEGSGERLAPVVDNGCAGAAMATSRDDDVSDTAGALYAMVDKTLLCDVRVLIPPGQLTVVVGATGSGKSSLLAVLLGTLRFDGHAVVTRPVAYVPQQPWIMQDTVEANITFFEGDRRRAAGGAQDGGGHRKSVPHYGATQVCSPLRCTPHATALSLSGCGRSGVRERVARAVRCCQMDADIALMPRGLWTEIGERGVNLSGGQKARLSLARAVYADCELYLLDDPLSALDAHVGRLVMNEVVLRALAGKTRLLVTHQLQVLPYADQVVVMQAGRIVFADSYASYITSEWKAYMENEEAAAAVAAASKKSSRSTGGSAEGDNRGAEAQCNAPSSVGSSEVNGRSSRAPWSERAPVVCGDCEASGSETKSEGGRTDDEPSAKPHWHTPWSPEDSKGERGTRNVSRETYASNPVRGPAAEQYSRGGSFGIADDAVNVDGLMTREEKETGHIPWSVYRTYFESGGGVSVAVQLTLRYLLAEIISKGSNVWVTLWSVNYFSSFLSTREQLGVYLGLVFVVTVILPLNDALTFQFARRASRRLHATLLYSVTSANLMFFDRTPLGRIVNRFSKDIYVIDDELPANLIPFLGISGYALTSLAVTVCTSPLSVFAVVLAAYAFARLLKFYTTVVREVRRRGSVVQSPLFSLLEEVLHGRATIAAYGKSHVLFAEALQRLDLVYSCSYVEKLATLWLALRIEYVAALVSITVGVIGVAEKLLGSSPVMPEARVGLVSLSLTMCLDLSWCLSAILELAASVEASMNSVQRVGNYIDCVPREALLLEPRDAYVARAMAPHGGRHFGSSFSPSNASDIAVISGEEEESDTWRQTGAGRSIAQSEFGALRLEHVDMRYRPGLPLVLRDVSFSIAPGQKIGVVGRTGSGKSTLLLALLRLVETCGGRILVCGRDVRTYTLPALRRLFSMIPQDPVLFDGTIRSNLDPFGASSDEELRAALESVGLVGVTGGGARTFSSAAESAAGAVGGNLTLDTIVQEGGLNFSVGQRQLLCLARALLKKGSAFILMDEATANVDARLCQTVQRVVAEQFATHTILTIAHRLHTVVTYDVVLVMSHGRVVEMGSPRELLTQQKSVFYGMVAQSAAAGASNDEVSRENAEAVSSTPHGRGDGGGGPEIREAECKSHLDAVFDSLLRQCK
ncbi:hypothetical protein JKF63_03870 [Porcisia hertigi]|uniref:Uncharacterized protein n=1 Tax=Porcisia hertigi TaxID=2761500 RepID=A0A836IKY0_9TRYP|nr:hypothetical protein JKF63_03870 [Porcisia hertigi]